MPLTLWEILRDVISSSEQIFVFCVFNFYKISTQKDFNLVIATAIIKLFLQRNSLKICFNFLSKQCRGYQIKSHRPKHRISGVNLLRLQSSIHGSKAYTFLQQYHFQIITIISPAKDLSKQTLNRDVSCNGLPEFL